MPAWREKSGGKQDFLKRRSFAEGHALIHAAHLATYRLYCDAFGFWRRCQLRTCQRHRRCLGESSGCIIRGLIHVPLAERIKAQPEVIAGGPRRIPPASHIERQLRRETLFTLLK